MATSYYEQVQKDSGLKPVNAKELQSKFDAITEAEYDKQRTELQTATNKYYNQLYDTQQTTMDTIRQANAQAVASGASKGVQAANELSALLGLQSEAVTGATDLANRATTLAQDETQAMLDNMLNAETQAAEQNQALAQILTQAGSVDVEQQNAETALLQVIETIKQTNPTLAEQLQNEYDINYRGINTTTSAEGEEVADTTVIRQTYDKIANTAAPSISFNWNDFAKIDFGKSGADKIYKQQNAVENYVRALGIEKQVNVAADLGVVAGAKNKEAAIKAWNDLMQRYKQQALSQISIK